MDISTGNATKVFGIKHLRAIKACSEYETAPHIINLENKWR
jgi:hypothetical protein